VIRRWPKLGLYQWILGFWDFGILFELIILLPHEILQKESPALAAQSG
jgi:hypothetical protein